ncbi:PC-Esterase [Corchorus capsularis]|uniref:PC-Esterase n=1 Tax=Corchorus capsularis TaxID=210143 RepID=A0A1R3IIK5_COCAP|nr:PC-Esterase [Corchorus capsularis]
MDQVPTQTRHQLLLPSTPFVIFKKQLCCSLSFVFILISSVVVFNLGGSFSQPLSLFRFDGFEIIIIIIRFSFTTKTALFLILDFNVVTMEGKTSSILNGDGNPMAFQDYNLTVEYYRTPFLVVINRPPENSPAEVKVTVRVDEMHWFSQRWKGANVLVLNTGHWWNKEKTVKMYYCLSFHGLSFAA